MRRAAGGASYERTSGLGLIAVRFAFGAQAPGRFRVRACVGVYLAGSCFERRAGVVGETLSMGRGRVALHFIRQYHGLHVRRRSCRGLEGGRLYLASLGTDMLRRLHGSAPWLVQARGSWMPKRTQLQTASEDQREAD